MKHGITEVTRRAVFDFLSSSDYSWFGRLSEPDFLSRLYDLASMPSLDRRMKNAADDIWQHRENWVDWGNDWVFYDSRFNLMRCPDEQFLEFICETVHPVVQPEAEEALAMVYGFNEALRPDGWHLVEIKKLSGRPVFGASLHGANATVFEEPTGWVKVDRQVQEMTAKLNAASTEEQFQAVGLLCREALISVAQAAFVPELHSKSTGSVPSDTDAKALLEAFIGYELRGSVNEEARALAKSAMRLANALQHKRTADFRIAALAAEATTSVVNMVALLAGRREHAV